MSYDHNNYEVIDNDSNLIELSRSFFANVYKYMFLALSISGFLAYMSAKSGWYLSVAFNSNRTFTNGVCHYVCAACFSVVDSISLSKNGVYECDGIIYPLLSFNWGEFKLHLFTLYIWVDCDYLFCNRWSFWRDGAVGLLHKN
jgi:FtsH-binding integral membrane protein